MCCKVLLQLQLSRRPRAYWSGCECCCCCELLRAHDADAAVERGSSSSHLRQAVPIAVVLLAGNMQHSVLNSGTRADKLCQLICGSCWWYYCCRHYIVQLAATNRQAGSLEGRQLASSMQSPRDEHLIKLYKVPPVVRAAASYMSTSLVLGMMAYLDHCIQLPASWQHLLGQVPQVAAVRSEVGAGSFGSRAAAKRCVS